MPDPIDIDRSPRVPRSSTSVGERASKTKSSTDKVKGKIKNMLSLFIMYVVLGHLLCKTDSICCVCLIQYEGVFPIL